MIHRFSLILAFLVLCSCYAEPKETLNVETQDIDEQDPITEDAERRVIIVGDPGDTDGSNPLLCGMNYTITYFLFDDDEYTDTIDFENFGEEYIWSQVIDDRSGTAIAKDGSCPRSVGQTSQEAVGIPCHIEQHPTSLHVYENQEITFIVERCNDALYISCEICKQLGIIIPTETGAETAE